MFLSETVTAFVIALRETFDGEYPEEDFRNLHVSVEFPVERQHYPSLWVDFEPQRQINDAGINHVEDVVDDNGDVTRFRRWRFAGDLTITGASFKSLERNRLMDEVIKTIIWAETDPQKQFRSYIEDNEFVAVVPNWSSIALRNLSSSPGTPWDTAEMIYEFTIALSLEGEFVSDGVGGGLVELVRLDQFPYTEEEGDPTSGGGWV